MCKNLQQNHFYFWLRYNILFVISEKSNINEFILIYHELRNIIKKPIFLYLFL